MNDIVGGLMNGLSFVANMAEQDRRRMREAEQEAATRLGADYIAATAPHVAADGTIVPLSLGQMYNTEAGRRLANNPLIQRKAMEGVPEHVKSVEVVRAEDLPGADPQNPRVALHVVWKDEDGNPISEGPVTEGRSTAPDDHVVQFSPNDVHSLVLNQVYQHNPGLARQIHEQTLQQSTATLANLLRQTDPTDTATINGILKAASYHNITPSQLASYAARPTTEQMPATGLVKTSDPITGTVRYTPDAPTQAVGQQSHTYATQRAIEEATTKAPVLRQIEEGDIQSRADATAKAAQTTAPVYRDIKKGDALAQSQTDLALAPTYRDIKQADTRAHAETVNDVTRALTGKNNRDLRDALADLGSADPTRREQADKTLDQFPERERLEAGGLRARAALKNLDTVLRQGTSQIEALITEHAPYLSDAEQKGLYAALASRVDTQQDPRALPALRTLNRVMHGAKADQPPPAAEPPKFSPDLAAKYIRERMPTDAMLTEAPLRMKERFEYLTRHLPENYTREDAAASDAQLHMAVADAEDLDRNHAIRNAELPMLDRARWQTSYGQAAVGDPRSYMLEVYDPLKLQLQAHNVAVDPARLSTLSELVVALRSHGVESGDAVGEAVRVATDPAYSDHVQTIARRLNGHSSTSPASMQELAGVLAKDLERRAGPIKRTLTAVGEGLRGTN